MSLKTFHVVFVTLSLLLTVGLVVGFGMRFTESHSALDLGYALGWLAMGAALLAYGRYFLRKLRRVGWL